MKNTCSRSEALSRLRLQLETLEQASGRRALLPSRPRTGDGFAPLATGVVHDLYAACPADGVALGGFSLGLAIRAAGGRPVVWVLDEMTGQEAGQPYGPGLHQMGLSVRDLVMVRVRDTRSLLAVGEEALNSPAIGAVVLNSWGEGRAMSLTASRRLALAAQTSGSTLFLARTGADPAPSAAETRWSVSAAPSRAMEANAPGLPTFCVTLLRHRHGDAPRTWTLEWDRERRSFVEPAFVDPARHEPSPLPGRLVSLAAERTAGARAHGSDHSRAA